MAIVDLTFSPLIFQANGDTPVLVITVSFTSVVKVGWGDQLYFLPLTHDWLNNVLIVELCVYALEALKTSCGSSAILFVIE